MLVETDYDFEQLMRQLAGQVEPTAAKKDAAARSQNYLRALLSEGTFGGRVVKDYLSGSYSRGTAIHPLDDVDIIFVIDPRAWADTALFPFDPPNPAAVLKSFAGALRRRYERTSVRIQRRSVCLALSHLDIDVVPAIELAHGFIQIPDGDSGTWIKSGPTIHKQIGAAINTRTRGAFKPTVKLLKYWNSMLPSTARFKSFAVESMAMALFAEHGVDGLFDSVVSFFDFMASLAEEDTIGQWPSAYGIDFSWFGPKVPDPSGATSNIVRGLDAEVVEKFLEHAVRARNSLVQAAGSGRSVTAGRLVAKALKFDVAT